MGGRLVTLFVLVAVAAGLVVAPAAEATFHLIKVREVFPGTVAQPSSSYVELQMYASGQNLVQNGNLKVFDAAGNVTHGFTPSHAVTGAANQSTVLIADSGYAAQFPAGPTPDFTDASLNLSPAGGAVCWPQTEPPFDDCASWGNFSGQAMLASTDTAPVAPSGIPDGSAVRRSIAPGCATLLESDDDSNDSAVDFSVIAPEPRSNAMSPTEQACGSGGAPGGGGNPSNPGGAEEGSNPGGGAGAATPPQTILTGKPAARTRDRTPSFRFRSAPTGASFQCAVDRTAYKPCRSPFTAKALKPGKHTFQVRAMAGRGTPDPSPASYSFRVLRKRS